MRPFLKFVNIFKMDEADLVLLFFIEILGQLWPFAVGFCKNLHLSLTDSFLKKTSTQKKFLALVKKVHFSLFVFQGKS